MVVLIASSFEWQRSDNILFEIKEATKLNFVEENCMQLQNQIRCKLDGIDSEQQLNLQFSDHNVTEALEELAFKELNNLE
jgi:hypothetical protein